MKRYLLAGVALALVCADPANAQSPDAPATPPFPKTPAHATELPPGYPPVDSSKVARPLQAWHREGRPLGCWASFNGYSCTSLKSTLVFTFGSCRDFYGEPCLKGAPPSALPPWAGRQPAPGGPAGKAGCTSCGGW